MKRSFVCRAATSPREAADWGRANPSRNPAGAMRRISRGRGAQAEVTSKQSTVITFANRASSKLEKLRLDPSRFFQDARNPVMRTLGSRLVSTLYRHPSFLDLMEDPFELYEPHPRSPWSAKHATSAVLSFARRTQVMGCKKRDIGVILAARDAAPTLRQSVTSLLHQSLPPKEILIVDDGSKDETLRIAMDLAAQHPTVRAFSSRHAYGAACARNVGLAHATTDLITFQDADDWSHRDRLAVQVALLDRSAAFATTCMYRRVLPDGRPVRINGRRVRKLMLGVLFPRRTTLDRIGYLQALHTGEDTEFFDRLRAIGPISTSPRVLYYARFSSTSLLFGSGETRIDDDNVQFVADEAQLNTLSAILEENHRLRRAHQVRRVDFSPPSDYSEVPR